jgi:hypothetical protein
MPSADFSVFDELEQDTEIAVHEYQGSAFESSMRRCSGVEGLVKSSEIQALVQLNLRAADCVSRWRCVR